MLMKKKRLLIAFEIFVIVFELCVAPGTSFAPFYARAMEVSTEGEGLPEPAAEAPQESAESQENTETPSQENVESTPAETAQESSESAPAETVQPSS